MTVYIDLENLLKEKQISKNKLCLACNLQRTQLNNYCKNKVSRIDLSILARICEFLDCKLRSNGMPVPLLRNGYSIFNGTKYR